MDKITSDGTELIHLLAPIPFYIFLAILVAYLAIAINVLKSEREKNMRRLVYHILVLTLFNGGVLIAYPFTLYSLLLLLWSAEKLQPLSMLVIHLCLLSSFVWCIKSFCNDYNPLQAKSLLAKDLK